MVGSAQHRLAKRLAGKFDPILKNFIELKFLQFNYSSNYGLTLILLRFIFIRETLTEGK